MKYSVIVPTLNASRDWSAFSSALLACVAPGEVLIVDSESADGTPDLARRAGFQVVSLARGEFNHGGTRQWAIQFAGAAEVIVFLTQDAILADPRSIERLVAAFDDPLAGAAFGRQVARSGAGPIERHARLFNYPPSSSIRTLASKETIGFKAIFLSNSFAAYRRTAFESVGGFPTNVIIGEDTVTAARMLLAGMHVHYVAEAMAYHSHAYSAWQEFQRYFDTGVLHSREEWLLREFGGTGGDGKRFVLSELDYLRRHDPFLIPAAFARTAAKWLGYSLGRHERSLGARVKTRLSMHSGFWKHRQL